MIFKSITVIERNDFCIGKANFINKPDYAILWYKTENEILHNDIKIKVSNVYLFLYIYIYIIIKFINLFYKFFKNNGFNFVPRVFVQLWNTKMAIVKRWKRIMYYLLFF